MEKTNSNIPTPEELKAYIDESVISVTGTYEQSASVLMVDDSIIGTLGNFSASIGKAKSKKTFNVSASGDDYFGVALQPFYQFVRIVRTVHSSRLKCFILRLGLRVEVMAVYNKHHLVHIIQFGNELCSLE